MAVGRNLKGQINVGSWTDIVQVAAANDHYYSHTVGLKADGTVVAVGRNLNGQINVGSWTDIVQVAADRGNTVGLKADGTVVAVGGLFTSHGELDVGSWTDIVQVAVRGGYALGVKDDGTLEFAGHVWEDALDWTDIVQLATTNSFMLGLKTDRTVVAEGTNYWANYGTGQLDVGSWSDIVQVDAGGMDGLSYSIGLKADGTVVAVGYEGSGQLNVGSWTDIVQVAAAEHCYECQTVGLKDDGSVVAVGNNSDGQLEVGSWTDIVQVAANNNHTIGVKDDGTVVAVGDNNYGQLDVASWTDIVQVAADMDHTVGIKTDGTVVAVGSSYSDQFDLFAWNLITNMTPEIEVTPSSYNFGDVEWKASDTAILTISNTGDESLSISGITINDDFNVFSSDIDPLSLPINLLPGEFREIVLSFTPNAIQTYEGSLVIESNDADEPIVEIPLSGNGVISESPSEQVTAVTDYIQDSISIGQLTGEGEGESSDKKVNALINMIEAAGNLLENGQLLEGCEQLASLYKKVDGDSTPPDFVSGPAIYELSNIIQELMSYYGCVE